MFSSLRSRLWLTYALLIATALSMVAVVLLFYLIRNPLPYRQTLERVRAAEKLITRSYLPILDGTGVESLESIAETFDVRVVIFSSEGRSILRDTRPLAGMLPMPPETATRRKLTVTRDSDGLSWIYSKSTLPNGTVLLVAAPRPRVAGLAIFTDELLPLFLQGGALAFLLSLVLAFVLARWVADPLQKMVSAAREVPSGYGMPVEPRGPREVQDVMRAFNSMVGRVQASQESQRGFVANVSHELKTPLTSIQGFAQAILDGTADSPDARRQAAEVILAESARMHRMVLDLLDLARLDSGTADLTMAPVDLPALLKSIAEKFAPLAKQAGVTVSVHVADVPLFEGDGDRLAQVFTNLVDNALKFTPSGGEVAISARQEGTGVEIEVRDTGTGIASDVLPHVFDRFYQADASRARKEHQGAGLGLAIAREIVGAHSGKISVRSQLGQGTTFIVTLPLAQPNSITVATRK